MIAKHRGAILFWLGVLAALGAGWRGYPHLLYQRVAQPVAFSHKVHTGQAGMKCEDCHSLRADGTFTGAPGVDKCAGCHAAPMGSSAQEKLLVDRYVTPNREIPWQSYARQPDSVYFSHAYHVGLARLACVECHGKQGESTTLEPVEINRISQYSRSPHWLDMNACSDCHRQRGTASSCLSCHK